MYEGLKIILFYEKYNDYTDHRLWLRLASLLSYILIRLELWITSVSGLTVQTVWRPLVDVLTPSKDNLADG